MSVCLNSQDNTGPLASGEFLAVGDGVKNADERLGENVFKSGGSGQHFAFASIRQEAGASEPDQHYGPTGRERCRGC